MNNDNYKKWFIGLAGGFVVIAGVLTSSFYVSYEKVKGELAQISGELLNAQSQVEDLTKELEESGSAGNSIFCRSGGLELCAGQ